MITSMENQEPYSGYKLEVLEKLRLRNKKEGKEHAEIFKTIYSQYEKLELLRRENRKLINHNENLQSNIEFGCLQSGKINHMIKLRKQNQELTQKLTKLRAALDKKEKEIKDNDNEIQQLSESLTAIKNQYQFLKDEHEALQITFSEVTLSSIEEKKKKIDNSIELKEDSDSLNWNEESFIRMQKDAELQQILEEIANKPVQIDIDSLESFEIINPPIMIGYNLSKELYKFVVKEVNTVAWTRLTRFVTAGGDHKVKLWDFTFGAVYLKGIAHESSSTIYSIDFDREERLVLASTWDGTSRIWTLDDMRIKHTLFGHTRKVMSAKFLGEQGKVVSGSSDRSLKIWDLQRRSCLETVFAFSSVNDVVTSYGFGSEIISGHFDKNIRFWDLRSKYKLITKIPLEGRITSLDLSLDGYTLLSSVREDNSLQLIDMRMNNVVRTFRSDGFLIGCEFTRAKFSPDGQFCVCGSHDGGVYIWDVSTGAVEKVLREHSSPVVACAWSWCGSYLLSCDRTGNAIMWLDI